MLFSSLIAGNLNNNKRPDYTKKSVEDQFYTENASAVIAWPLPHVSIDRIRHTVIAAKQAFVTFSPASNT